jgi:hypothetical protein
MALAAEAIYVVMVGLALRVDRRIGLAIRR